MKQSSYLACFSVFFLVGGGVVLGECYLGLIGQQPLSGTEKMERMLSCL